MMRINSRLSRLEFLLCQWVREEKAAAALESVILLPVLVSLLMGCYDLGQGITTNQRVIGASQIIGDLVARDRAVTMTLLQDMVKAGELAIKPYPTEPFGYDIASVEFEADGDPVVLWRVTENMDPNDDAVSSTELIGAPGEGVLIVSTSYKFKPFFSGFVVDQIDMLEVAFLRGRKSATISCADCPKG